MVNNMIALIHHIAVCLTLCVSLCSVALGQFSPAGFSERLVDAFDRAPNIPTPTLGGQQFWTDYQWHNGWRLQQNAVTGHWRLLDPQDVRREWGNCDSCLSALQNFAPEANPSANRFVVVLHGLFRTRESMEELTTFLAKDSQLVVVSLEYASTRGSIAEHAAAVRSVVDHLPANAELNFVAHSMGNIVLRRAIYDWQQSNSEVLNRLNAFVMLGPPNNGAAIARSLGKTGVFGLVAGDGANELGRDWETISGTLAVPPCPFGIIAGHLEDSPLANPLVSDANDGVVKLAETKLPGATDFMEVPIAHSDLMDDEIVQQAVARFLYTHRFVR